jgi:hypothetical protein
MHMLWVSPDKPELALIWDRLVNIVAGQCRNIVIDAQIAAREGIGLACGNLHHKPDRLLDRMILPLGIERSEPLLDLRGLAGDNWGVMDIGVHWGLNCAWMDRKDFDAGIGGLDRQRLTK